MSELIKKNAIRATLRWKLLTGASAFALGTYVSVPMARAEDTGRPLVWIEVGGQLEGLSDAQSVFVPPFFNQADPAVLAPMTDVQRPSHNSLGESGTISFLPEGSDWVFSLSLRYGRSNATKHLHYETAHPSVPLTNHGYVFHGQQLDLHAFGDGQGDSREAHLVLDFLAGKDVGLGLFGRDGSATFSAGVRFAQFTSATNISLHARPMYRSGPSFGAPGKYSLHSAYFQSNTAVIESKRNTHAVGPAMSWDASLAMAGNPSDMEMSLDWGINAAILFGRQRAKVHHETKGYYCHCFASVPKYSHSYTNVLPGQNRSHSVTIPNVGGFAGVSLKFPNAKVSVGYRADFFFNAADNGVDTRMSGNIGFYGPFASVSVGLGN